MGLWTRIRQYFRGRRLYPAAQVERIIAAVLRGTFDRGLIEETIEQILAALRDSPHKPEVVEILRRLRQADHRMDEHKMRHWRKLISGAGDDGPD
ncbi:MAG: hypothetical protein PVH68_04735 [Armatimonadota bacterium]|jgi:hypothetical protein